jgi:hypothetical protein
MAGYPLGLAVFNFFLELEDLAPELEILRKHAGAFVLEVANFEGLGGVYAGKVAVLAKKLSADWISRTGG